MVSINSVFYEMKIEDDLNILNIVYDTTGIKNKADYLFILGVKKKNRSLLLFTLYITCKFLRLAEAKGMLKNYSKCQQAAKEALACIVN